MLDSLVDGRHDLSLAEYHSLAAWGSSDLKAMRLGPPALVPWRRANPTPETDATKLGTAAHCRILEPGLFGRIYAHKPEGMSFSSKEGKAWRDDPCRAEARILTHDEWVAVEQIAAAFDGKAPASSALDRAVGVEASFVVTDPNTGERIKARPDWFDGEAIYDLKVSRHAVERSVAFQSYIQGWMHQVAFYRDVLRLCGVEVAKGRLVVVAPKPPQHLAVYCVEVKDGALDWLALDNDKTLARLAACRVSGCWPSTPDEWVKVEPPPSALAEFAGLANFEEV